MMWEECKDLQEYIVGLRRDLHQIPEVGFDLPETQAYVTAELNKLGAQVEQTPDALIIHGVSRLHGGTCDSHGDHRIAMMLAVAATCADGVVEVTGAASVAKSYPDFWEVYESLGGRVLRQREEREACDM